MESAWNSLFWHDSNCIHSFSNWIKCSFQSIPCKRLKAVEWIFLNWGDIVNVICIRLKKFVNNYFNLKYDIVQVAHRTLLPGMLPWAIASNFFFITFNLPITFPRILRACLISIDHFSAKQLMCPFWEPQRVPSNKIVTLEARK